MSRRDGLRRRLEALERSAALEPAAFQEALKGYLRTRDLPPDPVVAAAVRDFAGDLLELEARGEGWDGWLADYSKSGDPE